MFFTPLEKRVDVVGDLLMLVHGDQNTFARRFAREIEPAEMDLVSGAITCYACTCTASGGSDCTSWEDEGPPKF
jgi:hypothetical protein